MTRSPHSPSSETKVPHALVKKHHTEWNHFTRAIVIACASVATVLVLMLLFLRIL